MIKNAPFGARFLMKSGSGNEEIVTGAQITQGEGYANAQAFAGVAETGGICKGAEHHCRRRRRERWVEFSQENDGRSAFRKIFSFHR